jgi:hypothetical protein
MHISTLYIQNDKIKTTGQPQPEELHRPTTGKSLFKRGWKGERGKQRKFLATVKKTAHAI